MTSRADHWNAVYQAKAPTEVSWFQESAATSLALIRATSVPKDAAIVDVGAGASRLVDGLLAEKFSDITLLDLSEEALSRTRERVGTTAGVRFVVHDVTTWEPPRRYDLWHDRAVFHFLTDAEARAHYFNVLKSAVAVGGHAIVATFALDGPERCSNLPVQRYSVDSLSKEFDSAFALVESKSEVHVTPWGSSQSFMFCRFLRER